jgi:hypothetical protein
MTSVLSAAIEDGDGTPNSWSVRAHAICAAPIAGLELVPSPPSARNSSNKSATATCPAGKKVLGAGGDLLVGGGHVLMPRITPSPTLDRVTVDTVEDADPTTADWTVRAYAICASPPTGLTRVDARSDPLSPSTATARCPASTRVIGAGGEIDHDFLDDVGDALLEGGHLLEALRPDTSLTSVTVSGSDGQHAWGTFHAVAYAICAVAPGTVTQP